MFKTLRDEWELVTFFLVRCCTFTIFLYQRWVSPVLGHRCRYFPPCSQYVIESLEAFGLIRGGWIGLGRLLRCHPWQRGGVDELPTHFCSRGPHETH